MNSLTNSKEQGILIRFKKILLGSIGISLFAIMSLAQAQNAPGPEWSGPRVHAGQRIQEIYSQLNLTDDQKKQLEANKHQHRLRMQQARMDMKVAKEALREELMKTQLDIPKVMMLHDRIKALLSQMEDIKINSILSVRRILTPEQFSKFVVLMHKHKEGHEEEHE